MYKKCYFGLGIFHYFNILTKIKDTGKFTLYFKVKSKSPCILFRLNYSHILAVQLYAEHFQMIQLLRTVTRHRN